MPIEDEHSGNGTFLDHLKDLKLYFMQIDSNQEQKYNNFMLLSVYAQLTGAVQLRINSSNKLVKKWSSVRKLMKADAYKAASLAPRTSDVDFSGDAADNTLQVEADNSMSDDYMKALIDEVADAVEEVSKHCEANAPMVPVIAHPSAATALNQSMLEVLKQVQQRQAIDGRVTKEFAAICLATAAGQEVMSTVPLRWDNVAEAIEQVKDNNKMVEAQRLAVGAKMFSTSLSLELLFLWRLRLFTHICHSLGQQQFLDGEDGVTTLSSYWCPVLLDCAQQVKNMTDECVMNASKDGSSTPGPSMPSLPLDLFKVCSRSTCNFVDFMLEWSHIAFKLSMRFQQLDMKAYAQQKEEIRAKLIALPAKDLPEFLQR